MAITYGSEAVIQSAATSDIKVAMLDITHAIIVYVDEASGLNFVRAVIATIDGMSISYGSEYTVNAAWSMSVGLGVLDSTHAVITYYDSGNNGYGTSRTATVSGSTISFGTEATFNANISYINQVAVLDSTHFAVAFNDYNAAQYGAAVVGVVSGGSTITYGTKVTFNTSATTEISASGLDSTHFVVSYQEASSWNGRSIIGVVSNDDEIAFGSYASFNTGGTSSTSTVALTSTSFLVSYRDGSNTYGRATIGVVSSGSTITLGLEYTFNAANTAYTAATVLDSTHAIIAYEDSGGSYYGRATIATISNDDEIAFGTEDEFNAATTTWVSITALTSSKVIIAYRDEGNTNFGTAIIGATASATGKSLTGMVDLTGATHRAIGKIIMPLIDATASVLYALPPPVLDAISKVGACLYLTWT